MVKNRGRQVRAEWRWSERCESELNISICVSSEVKHSGAPNKMRHNILHTYIIFALMNSLSILMKWRHMKILNAK